MRALNIALIGCALLLPACESGGGGGLSGSGSSGRADILHQNRPGGTDYDPRRADAEFCSKNPNAAECSRSSTGSSYSRDYDYRDPYPRRY
jgi:hypothetical protein